METDITTLKGVGSKAKTTLARLGIETVGDLVYHFPRRYDDFSQVQTVASIKPGAVSLKITVTSVSGRYARRGLHVTQALLSDDTGSIQAVWFNQPYRAKQIRTNQQYYCSGMYEYGNRRYSIMNPSLELVSELPIHTARILPIYPETKGLRSHQIRKLIAQIDFDQLEHLEELPFETDLTRAEALRKLHRPSSSNDITLAQDYFAFEELFTIVLASCLIKANNQSLRAPAIPFRKTEVQRWVQSLPFRLTDAQRKVAWRALQDIERRRPMNRLLEGDVGSGKTVVAALLAFNVVLAGHQVAIMAPTEVLATQHVKNISSLLKPSGQTVALLTSATPAAEKKLILSQIKAGTVDVIIGTHSLIQTDLNFASLGLVIVDEQHRFGVVQRAILSAQAETSPHLLSMTATPIPRTLALTVFGDLDISIIDQLPKGRKAVKTKIISPNSRKPMYEHVLKELAAGRQAFVIYPLIEDSEAIDAKSVTSEYERLSKTVFKHVRTDILHGRIKSDEKDRIMRDFSRRKIDVLFSTTVIEVGVDVPNASVMIVEGAERFGLAQLHQLRGRVGRGGDQAYCFLIPSTSRQISKRLRALEATSDGFKLAEYDLQLRGPGAIYGTSQHGELDVSFTKLNDPKQIAKAQDIAQRLVNQPDGLKKFPQLLARLKQYHSITRLN